MATQLLWVPGLGLKPQVLNLDDVGNPNQKAGRTPALPSLQILARTRWWPECVKAFVNGLRPPVASARFVLRDSAAGGPEIREPGPGAGSTVLRSTESTESQGILHLPSGDTYGGYQESQAEQVLGGGSWGD